VVRIGATPGDTGKREKLLRRSRVIDDGRFERQRNNCNDGLSTEERERLVQIAQKYGLRRAARVYGMTRGKVRRVLVESTK